MDRIEQVISLLISSFLVLQRGLEELLLDLQSTLTCNEAAGSDKLKNL